MTRQEMLSLMETLFIGRTSDFAYQRENGRYVRANRPMTRDILNRHLEGETIGTYLMDEQGCCSCAVFDADQRDGLAILAQVQQRLAINNIPAYLEQSRRGGHLWVLFSQPLRASVVRRWLLPYCPSGVEFYPKQGEGSAYGSLIRVPFGIHALSGQRYPFLAWDDAGDLVPVAATVRDNLQWLAIRDIVDVSEIEDRLAPESHPARISTHTYMTQTAPRTRGARNVSPIQHWCADHDPFELIGRYVELNGRGTGCCPFGGHHSDGRDSHPSLFVYRPRKLGGACWHCHTWGKGGSLFDFLCLWHQMDHRTLWHHIQAGGAV